MNTGGDHHDRWGGMERGPHSRLTLRPAIAQWVWPPSWGAIPVPYSLPSWAPGSRPQWNPTSDLLQEPSPHQPPAALATGLAQQGCLLWPQN